nr:glycosyltransferase [Pseudodesulfovibrio sp.]
MKLISIVVPSYNHSEYIETCLDSIYFQDYENLEIIIVDDCSTDNSAQIIRNWIKGVEEDSVSFLSRYNEEKDEFIRTSQKRYKKNRSITFLENEQNLGSTGTYNRGFHAVKGEYCSFVASDDICHPQMYSTLAKHLDADQADFVYSDMFIIDDTHRILQEFQLPDYRFDHSFCDWYLCGVATLYKTSLHLSHGYYDESAMADDHECYLRFAINGARFMHVQKTLYSHRSHDTRQVGLHGKTRFSALLNHSKELALKARRWLASQGTKEKE